MIQNVGIFERNKMYLNSQSQSVAQNQDKHDIFKLTGVYNSPKFELRWILRDVDFYRLGFQCIVHTLALVGERSKYCIVDINLT